MQPPEHVIIPLVPEDTSRLPQVPGAEVPEVGDDWVRTRCSQCQAMAWLDPRDNVHVRNGDGLPVCLYCIVDRMKRADRQFTFKVREDQ